MTVEFSKLATLIHTINNDNKPWGASIIEVPTDIGRTWAGYKRGGIIEGARKIQKRRNDGNCLAFWNSRVQMARGQILRKST